MTSRRHHTSYSVDNVIKLLFFILLPVVILDILISCYVIYSMRSQTVQSLQDTTSLYISQIDTAHTSINKYMIRRLSENADFKTALETSDNLELISAYNAITKDVDTFMESFESGYQLFLYNENNHRLLRPTSAYTSFSKEDFDKVKNALVLKINNKERDSSYSDAWEILPIGSKVYFFKIFSSGHNHMGGFILADDIIQPLKRSILQSKGFISLTDKDGTPLTGINELNKLKIKFPTVNDDSEPQAFTQGQNLIISGALTMGIFRPQIVLNKFSVYEKIIVIQFALVGAILLISAILFCSMVYMKKRVLSPIKEFSENLSRYEEASEVIDLTDTPLLELEQASLQFKNLMRQIKKLKIDIYEKELEKQKTLMNYLQLQIRPHFFLNCLNSIYSMAQTQLYEEIMEMSMITSNYFRYIFQNPQDFIPVKSELEHIENYMKIQKLRYGDGFTYEIYAEEGTTEVRMLPILIQTFIENAIKHSAALDEPITIRTDVEWAMAHGNPYGNIQIQITDTGKGFPKDVLERLNSTGLLTPVDGHRIGITNAVKRLKLFYKEGEAAITFSNLPTKGACVTILLPADSHIISSQEVTK